MSHTDDRYYEDIDESEWDWNQNWEKKENIAASSTQSKLKQKFDGFSSNADDEAFNKSNIGETKEPQTWTEKQIRTKWHILSVLAFALLSIMPVEIVVVALLLLSIWIAILKVPSLILMSALVPIVTMIYPPLGVIISVVFFIMKVNFFLEHALPLGLGLFAIVYLLAISLIKSYVFQVPLLFIFALSAVIFQVILVGLYENEYSSVEAIQIMAIVPFYLLIIGLPIILNRIDGIGNVFEGNDYDEFEAYNENPDIHWVREHQRVNPSGSISTVKEHIRTNPDGFTENNLSK